MNDKHQVDYGPLSIQTTALLLEKTGRQKFLEDHLCSCIPLQIRALRTSRKMTQAELAALMNAPPQTVSRIETLNRNISLHTLRKLASAFDLALLVKFCSFSDLTKWDSNFDPESFKVPSFLNDKDMVYFANNAKYFLDNEKIRGEP